MLYGTIFILLVSVKTFQVLFSCGVTNGLKEDLWHFYYVLGYFQYQENYPGKIEIFKRWFEVCFWAKSLVEAFGLETLILLILSRLICCTPVITWKLYCNDGSLLPLQAAEGWMLLALGASFPGFCVSVRTDLIQSEWTNIAMTSVIHLLWFYCCSFSSFNCLAGLPFWIRIWVRSSLKMSIHVV